MNERLERLMSTMKLTGKSRSFETKLCHEVRILDDRTSAGEVELQEKKQAMKEPLMERRRTEVEEWRDTVAAEGGVTQTAAAVLKLHSGGCPLLLFEVGVKRFGGRSGIRWQRQGVAAEQEECVGAFADEP